MRYIVRYSPKAIRDLEDSYEWGVQNWGGEAAEEWYNDLEDLIERRLTSMPKSCPVAPETKRLGTEVRQLIYGRYRILYSVKSDLVTIIHLRGPYSEKSDEELD